MIFPDTGGLDPPNSFYPALQAMAFETGNRKCQPLLIAKRLPPPTANFDHE